jgi:hypothetical protein
MVNSLPHFVHFALSTTGWKVVSPDTFHFHPGEILPHDPVEAVAAFRKRHGDARVALEDAVDLGDVIGRDPLVAERRRGDEGAAGRDHRAAVLREGWYTNNRKSIGFGAEAPVPDWLDFELWQGPAPRRPFRDNLVHYNWHWYWDTGNGDTGNTGPHQLDLARWGMNLFAPRPLSATNATFVDGLGGTSGGIRSEFGVEPTDTVTPVGWWAADEAGHVGADAGVQALLLSEGREIEVDQGAAVDVDVVEAGAHRLDRDVADRTQLGPRIVDRVGKPNAALFQEPLRAAGHVRADCLAHFVAGNAGGVSRTSVIVRSEISTSGLDKLKPSAFSPRNSRR